MIFRIPAPAAAALLGALLLSACATAPHAAPHAVSPTAATDPVAQPQDFGPAWTYGDPGAKWRHERGADLARSGG